MKLYFKEVTLWRRGFNGVVLDFRGRTICIDTDNDMECDLSLTTRCRSGELREDVVKTASSISVKTRSMVNHFHYGGMALDGFVEIKIIDSCEGDRVASDSALNYLLSFTNGVKAYCVGQRSVNEKLVNVEKPIHLLLLPITVPEEACEIVRSLKPVLTIPIGFDKSDLFYKFRDICQPYTQVIYLLSD